MGAKARRRYHRRERRKARQSGFKRPGKSNSKKAGHGGSGQMLARASRTKPRRIEDKFKRAVVQRAPKPVWKLGDLAAYEKDVKSGDGT